MNLDNSADGDSLEHDQSSRHNRLDPASAVKFSNEIWAENKVAASAVANSRPKSNLGEAGPQSAKGKEGEYLLASLDIPNASSASHTVVEQMNKAYADELDVNLSRLRTQVEQATKRAIESSKIDTDVNLGSNATTRTGIAARNTVIAELESKGYVTSMHHNGQVLKIAWGSNEIAQRDKQGNPTLILDKNNADKIFERHTNIGWGRHNLNDANSAQELVSFSDYRNNNVGNWQRQRDESGNLTNLWQGTAGGRWQGTMDVLLDGTVREVGQSPDGSKLYTRTYNPNTGVIICADKADRVTSVNFGPYIHRYNGGFEASHRIWTFQRNEEGAVTNGKLNNKLCPGTYDFTPEGFVYNNANGISEDIKYDGSGEGNNGYVMTSGLFPVVDPYEHVDTGNSGGGDFDGLDASNWLERGSKVP